MHVLPEDEVVGLTHEDLDITDAEKVMAFVQDARGAVVINTAAYHDTGKCEQNPQRAFEVNALGPLNLARACEATDSVLVHVSTDYVFDGAKSTPYLEADDVRPLNVYGLSKAAGELAVVNFCSRHFVVRTCGLYGVVRCRAKGNNFVTMMLDLAAKKGELNVVTDEIVTPTWTGSLAKQIHLLCESDTVPYGIVHASDEGECSWYEFTKEILRLNAMKTTLKPASVEDFESPLRKPRYSVLENGTLKQAQANVMLPWRDALARYMALATPT